MRKHKGFTLVELVVVVMILGILAAVAAPKLLGTSKSATEQSLKQTLAVVRDAIERYAADNGGNLPGEANTELDFKTDLKDYLRGEFPKCPVGKMDAQIKITTTDDEIAGEASPTKGWHYCSANGQFICNAQQSTLTGDPPTYDKL
jgi:general secretion pathway protein G